MFKLLRSYFFWAYERGSVQYDVMVTLILLFMFVSPHFIDYNDKPVETVALHSSEVLVQRGRHRASGSSRFIYQIRADDMGHASRPTPNAAPPFCASIEPISGEVSLDHYEPVCDAQGKIDRLQRLGPPMTAMTPKLQ